MKCSGKEQKAQHHIEQHRFKIYRFNQQIGFLHNVGIQSPQNIQYHRESNSNNHQANRERKLEKSRIDKCKACRKYNQDGDDIKNAHGLDIEVLAKIQPIW